MEKPMMRYPLEQIQPGLFVVELPTLGELMRTQQLYLVVSGDLPHATLTGDLPRYLKVGSREQASTVISTPFPLDHIEVDPAPPPVLGPGQGQVYMRLNRHASWWAEATEAGELAVYQPVSPDRTRLELVALDASQADATRAPAVPLVPKLPHPDEYLRRVRASEEPRPQIPEEGLGEGSAWGPIWMCEPTSEPLGVFRGTLTCARTSTQAGCCIPPPDEQPNLLLLAWNQYHLPLAILTEPQYQDCLRVLRDSNRHPVLLSPRLVHDDLVRLGLSLGQPLVVEGLIMYFFSTGGIAEMRVHGVGIRNILHAS